MEIRDVCFKQSVARILSLVKSLPQEARLAQTLPGDFAAHNIQAGHRVLPEECKEAPLVAKGVAHSKCPRAQKQPPAQLNTGGPLSLASSSRKPRGFALPGCRRTRRGRHCPCTEGAAAAARAPQRGKPRGLPTDPLLKLSGWAPPLASPATGGQSSLAPGQLQSFLCLHSPQLLRETAGEFHSGSQLHSHSGLGGIRLLENRPSSELF